MDILESNRDHQDGQITRVCDVEDNNERAGFQPAEIKRAEDIVAFFSYVKSRWTQILPGDVQRKDKRQKNKFCLDKIIFHSKSAWALEHIALKLCNLHPWRCPKLDFGMALGDVQSSPCFQCWGLKQMSTRGLLQPSWCIYMRGQDCGEQPLLALPKWGLRLLINLPEGVNTHTALL